MFTKHERVFDVRHGFGKIVSIGHFDGFPVKVEFDNGRMERYSPEGFMGIDSEYPSLFPAACDVVEAMDSARYNAQNERLNRLEKE